SGSTLIIAGLWDFCTARNHLLLHVSDADGVFRVVIFYDKSGHEKSPGRKKETVVIFGCQALNIWRVSFFSKQ
ncbi:MAG: hypothetical protein QM668_22425, partial [Agriterribacter sp.]